MEDYYKIENNEWYRLVFEKSIFFNDIEKIAIKKLVPCEFINNLREYDSSEYNYGRVEEDGSGTIEINVIPDEWYLVSLINGSDYYKCDQLYGLKKCLKDILK